MHKLTGQVRRFFLALICAALALTACTPAILQKQYTSFDACYRQQKTSGALLGALGGALIGAKISENSSSGAKVATTSAVAALGALLGTKIAWETCLAAFPVKVQTEVVNARPVALQQAGFRSDQPISKSLVIQSIEASPLEFGKDLNIAVTYRYLSDSSTAKDIKAKVSRNLLFKGPDGAQVEVPSGTEDTIQQGVSSAKFSIPTPSTDESKELLTTSDWMFKVAIEVDGLREERTVRLAVPELMAKGDATAARPMTVSSTANGATPATPSTVQTATAPSPSRAANSSSNQETLNLRQGTALYKEPDLKTALITRLATAQPVKVLQRTVVANFNWVQVRMPDGKEGWFRGAPK